MNINMLEYLAAIEQYGSLSEAARHLYVSQPYLSRLVRQAEQEYGLTIFTRGRRGQLAHRSLPLHLWGGRLSAAAGGKSGPDAAAGL